MFEAFGKSLIYAKVKSGPRVEPRGIPQVLFLDQTGSTLYSKCFFVKLISVFTLHFLCLCLIRTMNVYCKKISVL